MKASAFFLLPLLACPPARAAEPSRARDVPAELGVFLKERRLDGYHSSPSTPAGEKRMLEHAHELMRAPGVSPAFKAAMGKRLERYRRVREGRERRQGRLAAPKKAVHGLGRVYAYPNPSRGVDPVIRVEAGAEDRVEVQVLTQGGAVVYEAVMEGAPSGPAEGGLVAYDHVWPLGRAATGVYVIRAWARGPNGDDLKATNKLAVIR